MELHCAKYFVKCPSSTENADENFNLDQVLPSKKGLLGDALIIQTKQCLLLCSLYVEVIVCLSEEEHEMP